MEQARSNPITITIAPGQPIDRMVDYPSDFPNCRNCIHAGPLKSNTELWCNLRQSTITSDSPVYFGFAEDCDDFSPYPDKSPTEPNNTQETP